MPNRPKTARAADHNKAVAEYFRRTGVTLQRHYVEVR